MREKEDSPRVTFRAATAADAESVAEIYLSSRKTFLSYAPLAHSDGEVRNWIATKLIPGNGVTVAAIGDELAGMMALSFDGKTGWIDHLYLSPTATGQGIGAQFIARAKAHFKGKPIRLYTFQGNTRARVFYERHGFQAVQFGNGSGNEEQCPDILYELAGGASVSRA